MTDFKTIIAQMKSHGMKTPNEQISIKTPNARELLEQYLTAFLHPTPMQWIPEYDQVAEWLEDNKGRGLLLTGPCGRGKSVLVRYVLPAILLTVHRKIVNVFDAQEMNEQLDHVLTRSLISLDDIGTEDIINKWGNKRVAFAEIMDYVEKKNKIVLISTNLDGKGLDCKYDNRIYDRIISMTRRVKFEGPSLRK